MKNEAVFVDCSGVFFSLFYEDEGILGRLIKLKSIDDGGGGGGGRDQTCVKEPFSQDRGRQRRVQQSFGGGGYLTVRGRESDGGGRGGDWSVFRFFLFVRDIIISIQKRGEGESRMRGRVKREREREREKREKKR